MRVAVIMVFSCFLSAGRLRSRLLPIRRALHGRLDNRSHIDGSVTRCCSTTEPSTPDAARAAVISMRSLTMSRIWVTSSPTLQPS